MFPVFKLLFSSDLFLDFDFDLDLLLSFWAIKFEAWVNSTLFIGKGLFFERGLLGKELLRDEGKVVDLDED